MKSEKKSGDVVTANLHPRNRHQGHYDFARLSLANTELHQYLLRNPNDESTIDFADPQAVKALNRALLIGSYGIKEWDIPATNLCPPVPGRADYLHHLADLLTASNHGKQPKKNNIQVLDIGTGANGIYPLIGVSEYGWQFVASDINPNSLSNVEKILAANPQLAAKISLRLQANSRSIFHNIIRDEEWFDLSMCNPPFHASKAEAQDGTQRKWQNLGKAHEGENLNFGGEDAELWCQGGEPAFIQNMIEESQTYATRCFWFTTLVSKSANLPAITKALKQAKVQAHKTINMQQGQKQSRFIAWTFLSPSQQAAWAKLRW
ncbi:MAG: 23S rRNA (adenine(1618)-N(6))-methyltransferase RlmF [Undibacterium sp.]|nr:23S rRNA (adenine(1618)-N(6))-methyltransferase RlmF [Undibacterium sp.]